MHTAACQVISKVLPRWLVVEKVALTSFFGSEKDPKIGHHKTATFYRLQPAQIVAHKAALESAS